MGNFELKCLLDNKDTNEAVDLTWFGAPWSDLKSEMGIFSSLTHSCDVTKLECLHLDTWYPQPSKIIDCLLRSRSGGL